MCRPVISPAEWSRWNVSLTLAVAPAWPAEPVGVAQPATLRMRARTPLQACIASLPLQSSWMSKTYLKSDHFNGGGSGPQRRSAAASSACPLSSPAQAEDINADLHFGSAERHCGDDRGFP